MKSYHIHIKGRVQGVGFRPFVYNLAEKFGLKGTVSNTLNGVHIRINASLETMQEMIEAIKLNAPRQSLITAVDTEEVDVCDFENFSIQDSDTEGKPDLLISPDFAICDDCKAELFDPNARRSHYPFITCTRCGPRFSLVTELPYDRGRTSMKAFTMCPDCGSEYTDTADRRFYSQTNSCPTCKISQWVVDANGIQVELQEDKITDFICDKITAGCVTAVKGIGGFLLICDASNEKVVRKLRSTKNRPTKPFALLYPDIASVKRQCALSDQEAEELTGPGGPIVLLTLSESSTDKSLFPTIAPELDRLGVMLPYAPILVLIAQKCGRVLLATSGNRKGDPIRYRNEEAVADLAMFADYLLLNNRDIQIPQDDSVLKFSKKFQHRIVIRRSRGYAPAMVSSGIDASFNKRVLSMGALLKSTFCIWQYGRCHISQYLGDTTDFDAQLSFEKTLGHFQQLLKFEPEVILADKHPAYFSAQLGKSMAHAMEVPLVEIQHHEAHLWAVLGENDLLACEEKILGVVFDGTGMGSDGAVWGGEFFTVSQGDIRRTNHVAYFPHILGDKMSKDPRLSALSLLHAVKTDHKMILGKFSQEEIDFYERVLEGLSMKTSSVGRLFDGVACLLGLCNLNTFEGEAAMLLECEAQRYCDVSAGLPESYDIAVRAGRPVDLKTLISLMVQDIEHRISAGEIAAKFHVTLVEIIEKTAKLNQTNKIAFSGGVFQNALLSDMLIEKLGKENQLYFHKELSPNDECISYGQLAAYFVSKKYSGNEKEFN